MKLSTRSRYGLRILLEIARNYKKRVVSVKEICESQKISRKYTEQILIKLKKSGIINGERGAKGGYKLSKDPSMITVDTIIEILENGTDIVNCKKCDTFKDCKTKNVWEKASKLLKDYFSNIKLSDLL